MALASAYKLRKPLDALASLSEGVNRGWTPFSRGGRTGLGTFPREKQPASFWLTPGVSRGPAEAEVNPV